LVAGSVMLVSLLRVKSGVHEVGIIAGVDSNTKPDALVVHEIVICPGPVKTERRGGAKTDDTRHVLVSLSAWDESLRTRLVASTTSTRTRLVPLGRAKPVTEKTVEVAPRTAMLFVNHCTLNVCVEGETFETERDTDAALVRAVTLFVAGELVSIGRIWL